MKITDIQVIRFRTKSDGYPTRWGYYRFGEEHDAVTSITKIMTDEGVEGYNIGGSQEVMDHLIKPLLVGENPLDREKLWHWMDQHAGISEHLAGFIDCALWDLYGRMVGLPVHKLLGGCRDKVKAYGSSAPNMGKPDAYVKQALECKQKGYKAYKIHAYIFFDPYKWEYAPNCPASRKKILRSAALCARPWAMTWCSCWTPLACTPTSKPCGWGASWKSSTSTGWSTR